MDENKIPASDIQPQSETGKKFENFWYYNKWKVIAAVFTLIVLIFCVVQCATKEKSDVGILYGGAMSASDTKVPDMKKAFTSIEPETFKKNGVVLTVTEIYSEEYIKESQKQQSSTGTLEPGETEYRTVNPSVNASNYENFSQLLQTGSYSVVIADKWIYDAMKGRVGLRGLDELLGEGSVPQDIRYDECGVIFKKTDFYLANQAAFSGVSDDAVICICIYSPFKGAVGCGGNNTDTEYERSIEMFRAILDFRIK